MHSGPRTKSPKEQKFNVSLTILYLTLFMWFVHTCVGFDYLKYFLTSFSLSF